MDAAFPLVAVVGRPNVGKSTLVNRFVGRRDAIVERRPGMTRDRKELVAEWNGRRFRVVDTGGWLAARGVGELDAKVSAQAERAIATADLVLIVVDATVGPTDDDERVVGVARRAHAPVLLVANKVDDSRHERDLWELDRLGAGPAIGVSALHGRGSGELLDAVVAALPPEAATEPVEPGRLAVAIVGRPNVGKSTLFNRLVGDERAIVHDTPGTTRDSVDTVVETQHGTVRFVDTAGMRRRSRIDQPGEYYGLIRALESVDRADAALLLIDATEGITQQDQRLAERIDAAGTAIVVVLNKWELLDAEARERVRTEVGRDLAFLGYAPVLGVSARTGRSVDRLLPALEQAREALAERVPTALLNRVLEAAQRDHPPPMVRGRRPKVLYATQGAVNPPTFTLFANGRVPATYVRYLERRLREGLDLGPAPIKLRVRDRASAP